MVGCAGIGRSRPDTGDVSASTRVEAVTFEAAGLLLSSYEMSILHLVTSTEYSYFPSRINIRWVYQWRIFLQSSIIYDSIAHCTSFDLAHTLLAFGFDICIEDLHSFDSFTLGL